MKVSYLCFITNGLVMSKKICCFVSGNEGPIEFLYKILLFEPLVTY